MCKILTTKTRRLAEQKSENIMVLWEVMESDRLHRLVGSDLTCLAKAFILYLVDSERLKQRGA